MTPEKTTQPTIWELLNADNRYYTTIEEAIAACREFNELGVPAVIIEVANPFITEE